MNPRRHTSIRRLLALSGTLAGMVLAVSLLSLALLDWRQAAEGPRRELAMGQRFAQALVEEKLTAARLLAEQVAQQAHPGTGVPPPATLLVQTTGGKILSSNSGRSLPRLRALAESLGPGARAGVELDDRGNLVAAGAVQADDRITVICLPITEEDAQAIKAATGLEVSFLAGQVRAISTLGEPGEEPPAEDTPAAGLPGAPGVDEPHWVEVSLAGGELRLQLEARLYGLDGSPVGICVVSRPWDGDWAWLLTQRWPWLAVMPASLALVALLTIRLGRRVLGPLQALENDLAQLVGRQGVGQLRTHHGLAEVDRLVQHVNQLSAGRAALAHNNERLNERLVQIQTQAVLGQLAAGVAHDLNNPLTTIMGLADIVLDADPDPDTRRDVAVIRRQAERSSSIVRSLLSFARRQRDEPQWVSLNELITQTLELLAYQARVSNVRCETQLAEDLPPTWVDPSQMQQVLFNLINNGLQAAATAHGRGTLRVESAWSPPAPGVPHGQVTIRVRDDGPGIPPDVLPRLFQPYFTTKAASGGTGLGLSIASDIIKRHSGRIWAENNTRGGACFTVQLPTRPDSLRGSVAQPQAPATGPRRVLLADGDAGRLSLLAQMLRRQGCVLSTADDGLLAQSRLELEPFDLVICGLELPGLDGRELYSWTRANRPELSSRFVFVLAGEITSEVEGFLQVARAWVLLPPFQEEALRTIINQALR